MSQPEPEPAPEEQKLSEAEEAMAVSKALVESALQLEGSVRLLLSQCSRRSRPSRACLVRLQEAATYCMHLMRLVAVSAHNRSQL